MADMEKKIILALALTVAIVVFLSVYWMNEPRRMAAAREGFRIQAVERGAELYAANCASCHGDNGQGVPKVGPILNSKNFLEAADDDTIFGIIRDGVPNTAMPAYGEAKGGPLRDSQVKDLVVFIRNWEAAAPELPTATPTATATTTPTTGAPEAPATTSQPGKTPTVALPVVAGDAAKGAELYAAHCVACHGSGGQGGPVAKAPLNSPDYLAAHSDEEIQRAIAEGIPGTTMPTYDDILTLGEIRDIIAFFRSWQ
jgi:cytochrome c oxidase cbb3-type subunit 3